MLKNIFADIPETIPEELIEIIGSGKNCRIERIVSRGHASPNEFWYDQEKTEFVILLQGAARLTFEDCPGPLSMKKGDYLVIAAHRRHRVEWTTPDQETIWLAVHY